MLLLLLLLLLAGLPAAHDVHAVVGLKEGQEGNAAAEALVPLHLQLLLLVEGREKREKRGA
jgi:hypothetical protein